MVGLMCASLALPLQGCQTGPGEEPSDFSHAFAQSALVASTQTGVYAITKDNPELIQTWNQVIRALDGIQVPTEEYWQLGREMIAAEVHPAYASGALLIYGVAETQLKGRFPTIDTDFDSEEFLRYIDAAKIGIKTGMLLAQPHN